MAILYDMVKVTTKLKLNTELPGLTSHFEEHNLGINMYDEEHT